MASVNLLASRLMCIISRARSWSRYQLAYSGCLHVFAWISHPSVLGTYCSSFPARSFTNLPQTPVTG